MGVVLYEMATCELAFEDGASGAIFDVILHGTPKRRITLNSEVPSEPCAS